MRIARALGRDLPVTTVSTFLGAHGLAPEYAGRRDDYVDFMCDEVMPEAVTPGRGRSGRRLLRQGRLHPRADGSAVRQGKVVWPAGQGPCRPVHRLRRRRAGRPAWRRVGRSPRVASLASVRAMAEAGTVATLLAGAHLTLHETRKPPVEMFREFGVPIALATNSNPVSSPTVSPASQMHLACYLFKLTARGGAARLHRERRAGARSLQYSRPHRQGTCGRSRRLGHDRSARHLLCDRRRAVSRRRQGRRRRARGAGADVRARMTLANSCCTGSTTERDRQLEFLRAFTRIDTCNPPGDTTEAADFFRRFLDEEGIAASHRGAAGLDAQPDRELHWREARPPSRAERPSRCVSDRRPLGVEARSVVGRHRRRGAMDACMAAAPST